MLNLFKESWHHLRLGQPGRRFREHYEFRRQRPGTLTTRIACAAIGGVLTIFGLLIGWLPGPGGFIAIFGLALLANEVRQIASSMDWCESQLLGLWQRTRTSFRGRFFKK